MTCGLAGARRIRGCAAAQSCGNSPILSLFGRAIISGILLDQSPLEEDSSVHEGMRPVDVAVAATSREDHRSPRSDPAGLRRGAVKGVLRALGRHVGSVLRTAPYACPMAPTPTL
jgi:hypothetical protein